MISRKMETLRRRLAREEHKIDALEYELKVKRERRDRVKLQIIRQRLEDQDRGQKT